MPISARTRHSELALSERRQWPRPCPLSTSSCKYNVDACLKHASLAAAQDFSRQDDGSVPLPRRGSNSTKRKSSKYSSWAGMNFLVLYFKSSSLQRVSVYMMMTKALNLIYQRCLGPPSGCDDSGHLHRKTQKPTKRCTAQNSLCKSWSGDALHPRDKARI